MYVKFIVFYDIVEYAYENRNNPLSSGNVVNYIISILNKNGIYVEIISPSETRNVNKYYKKRTTSVNENTKVTLGFTFKTKFKILNLISIGITRAWLILYLLLNTKKDEIIFVWHQIPLMMPLKIFKALTKNRNIKYIYSIGEIYQKVIPEKMSDKKKKMELSWLKDKDGYILSTNGIANYIDLNDNLSIVLPGGLNLNPCPHFGRKDSGIIHIVYSGVINATKGAKEAVDLAKYLDDKYSIHILGWGAKEGEVEKLREYINQNKKYFKCEISYDGILTGDNYISFLQKCTIGLCMQDVYAEYNDCSFPSKILTYLSNNLHVVCSDIVAVKNSKVADLIHFSDSNGPYEFSKIIKAINLNEPYDSIRYLKKISDDFEKELLSLINSV